MATIYRIFLKGLLTLLPITLTIYMLALIVSRVETTLREPLQSSLPESFQGIVSVPGFGIFVALLLVFVVGLLVNSYLTNWFFGWLETQLGNLPIVRSIYGPLRDVTKLFSRQTERGEQRVVMVQLDADSSASPPIEAVGLVMRDSFGDLPAGSILPESVAVFIPFSYGIGGFTLIVPKSRVRETSLPAERALQLALTGWIKSTK